MRVRIVHGKMKGRERGREEGREGGQEEWVKIKGSTPVDAGREEARQRREEGTCRQRREEGREEGRKGGREGRKKGAHVQRGEL
jgi:hypothetical protein